MKGRESEFLSRGFNLKITLHIKNANLSIFEFPGSNMPFLKKTVICTVSLCGFVYPVLFFEEHWISKCFFIGMKKVERGKEKYNFLCTQASS